MEADVREEEAISIRQKMAARRVFGYRIAARLRINPVRFSQLINGHVPLPADLAQRILTEIEKEAAGE
jgi:hypothetical protein